MNKPTTITAHDFELSPAGEDLLREHAAHLSRYYPRLIGCQVTVEGCGPHHRSGGPVSVKLELRVPGGELGAPIATDAPDVHAPS